MRKHSKRLLVGLLACSAILLIAYAILGRLATVFNAAGIVLQNAGIVQLHVSGFLSDLVEAYSDDARFPYGAPSHVTREIIDNPDTPIRTWLASRLFFDKRTTAFLVCAGLLGMCGAAWTAGGDVGLT